MNINGFGGFALISFLVSTCPLAVASAKNTGWKEERANIVESLPPRSDEKPNKFRFYKKIEDGNPSTKMVSKFWNESGKLIFEDETLVEKGRLSRYEVNRYQTGEKATISYDGKKLVFEYQEKDSKKKKRVEEQDDVVLTSGMIGPHIRKNWDKLLKNQRIKFRFASWDRMETVGFAIKYKRKDEVDGKKVYMFEMSPTSFVIALIVSPIKLYLTRDQAREMVLVDGRMAVKGERNGRLYDLDAKMMFGEKAELEPQIKPSS